MKKITLVLGLGLLLLSTKAQLVQDLTHLASYETGTADAAEVVAYDKANKQVYFTSAAANLLSILDVSNANAPVLVKEIDLAPYGGGPNSVAYYNGIVAVAVEATIKTDNGSVVLFDTDGVYLKTIAAGALPDMLTFSYDGTKIIVANEGEPNDDYSIDPDGSVTIIDLSAGIASATATEVVFTPWNDKKVSLQNRGVRIFGNNGLATVAQDLEPEFVTITDDNKYAYVNCQEANAVVLIDLTTNKLVDILPLGYKNHTSGTPSVKMININEEVATWPSLGTPVYNGGQPEVFLGGFSGLFYSQAESTPTSYVFYAVPDRGPNGDPIAKASVGSAQNLRPYKLPEYQARIVKFTVNPATGATTLDNQILLNRADGTTPISGKGNVPGFDEVPVAYADAATVYPNSDYTDGTASYHELPYDAFGGDMEGVLLDKDGDFWLCDENRPAIYQFQSNGTLKNRFVPQGTSTLGTTPQAPGFYGTESLPAVYSKRWANRGFEAIAYDAANDVVYAFIQSPMYNPSSATKDKSDVIRILAISAETGLPVAEYVYFLERNQLSGYSTSRVDKIGDACFIGDGKFIVIERDSDGPDSKEGKKYIFEINLKGATNILTNPISALTVGTTLELSTPDDLALLGIKPVHKTKVLNLPSIGYKGSDKAEGLAYIPTTGQMVVLNDNDFGLAGAGVTDNSVLGIISFDSDFSMDVSDKDNAINIQNWPTLGMLLPDAIASFSVDGKDYFVTANEGDSRDYDGYSEEVRVKDLVLDEATFGGAAAVATLQEDGNLGRLKTTTTIGDYDNDGDVDQIYSYGGRSFSIFDAYGNLVFDSGSDFETIASTEDAEFFNEDEGEKDKRSDDKGPEPEAIAIGIMGPNTYAFIGCERNSTILVYDVTNPYKPEFITLYNNRATDASPEIIKFVSSADSPNGKNMLVVGYEVSGTVGFIQIDGDINSISEQVKAAEFTIYPNPAVTTNLKLSEALTGTVVNTSGQVVKSFTNTNEITVSDLTNGLYILNTNKGVKRFIKL